MWWSALPVAFQIGSTIWNAVSGKKAAKSAAGKQAERDALLQQNLEDEQKAYEDWQNGEASYLRSQIAKARGPGLTDAGQAELEGVLEGQNRATRNLRRMVGPNAGTWLALDLEGAKARGGINLRDQIRKSSIIRDGYTALREGGRQMRAGVRGTRSTNAEVAAGDAARLRDLSSSAYSSVASGLMGIARSFAQGGFGQTESLPASKPLALNGETPGPSGNVNWMDQSVRAVVDQTPLEELQNVRYQGGYDFAPRMPQTNPMTLSI